MKRATPLLAATLAALCLFVSPALAQQTTGPGAVSKSQAPPHQKRSMQMLGVTPEKREAIRTIQGEYRDKLFLLRQDISAKSAALNAMMLQSQPNSIAAKAVSREMSALRVEEMDILIDMHTRIAQETGVRMPMGLGAAMTMKH